MYCSACGNKLNDDAKFCSNCGHKISISVCQEIGSQNNIVEKKEVSSEQSVLEETRVEKLLNKYFSNIVKQEDNVMLKSINKYRIAQYPKKQIERFTTDEPLLIFDYMGEGLNAGFVITEKQYIYIMRYDTAWAYNLQDLNCVVKDKKILATIIYCRCFNGEVSGDMYLNGIRKPDAFISAFNSFLLELNQPSKYAELQKQKEQERAEKELLIREHNIAAILKQVCEPYACQKTYCTIGAPLLSTNAKGRAVKEKFGIEQSTEIYLIYDSSILSNCSAGFVLCEQGLIYKLKHNNGTLGWDELKQCSIILTMTDLKIGDLSFIASSKEGKMAVEILTKIKELLK